MTRTRDPERRDKILRSAADLFGRRGYHAVSMAEIGADAGITGAGIYRHFDGKAEILVVLLDEVMDELSEDQAQIAARATGTVDLRPIVEAQVSFVVQRREVARIWYSQVDNLPPADRDRLRDKQRKYLADWTRHLRAARPELGQAEAGVRVRAAVGAIQSALFHNIALDARSLQEVLTTAALAVLTS
ncbi:MAG: TetR/AcrR family transcriptional regulator [Tetrasphaera sp.]